jgi:hypothetical protein
VTIDGYWIDSCVYWITVYTLQFTTEHTLYNSQQLSLFSSSEDFGSSSATTAATNSHGIPCHHYPGNSTELCTILTQCQSHSHITTDDQSVIKSWFQGPWGSKSQKSQSHITTDKQSVNPSWFRAPSGAHDQMLITVWHLLFCRCRAPPLTRGRVCHFS